MNNESLGSTIKTLLRAVSPMVWIWLVVLLVGFSLFAIVLQWRWFRSKSIFLWRIVLCLILACLIPFPISMNNGHSEGWTFFVPLCALFGFSFKAGLIVLAVVSLAFFGIWSAVIGIRNRMKQSK